MKIIRLKDVTSRTGLSRTTVYELIAAGHSPQQLYLGPRCVGWIEQEVIYWLNVKAKQRKKPTLH